MKHLTDALDRSVAQIRAYMQVQRDINNMIQDTLLDIDEIIYEIRTIGDFNDSIDDDAYDDYINDTESMSDKEFYQYWSDNYDECCNCAECTRYYFIDIGFGFIDKRNYMQEDSGYRMD